jgi:hypothetical protein
MKTKLFIIISVMIPIFLSSVLILGKFLSVSTNVAEVEISGKTFLVEVADEEKERNKGLSGRKTLGEDEGMLFIFETPTTPVFWMKDMEIPIDIVWISEGKIVGWVPNVLPEPGVKDENLSIYTPSQSVDMVLELSAGTVSREKFFQGEGVSLKL